MLRIAALLIAPFGALLIAGLIANATVGTQDGTTLAFRATGAPAWQAGDAAWRAFLSAQLHEHGLALPQGPLHRWPDKKRWGHRPRLHVDVLPDGAHAVRMTHIQPSTAARLALLASGTDGRVAGAVRAGGWLGIAAMVALPFAPAPRAASVAARWAPLVAGAAAATLGYFAAL